MLMEKPRFMITILWFCPAVVLLRREPLITNFLVQILVELILVFKIVNMTKILIIIQENKLNNREKITTTMNIIKSLDSSHFRQ